MAASPGEPPAEGYNSSSPDWWQSTLSPRAHWLLESYSPPCSSVQQPEGVRSQGPYVCCLAEGPYLPFHGASRPLPRALRALCEPELPVPREELLWFPPGGTRETGFSQIRQMP